MKLEMGWAEPAFFGQREFVGHHFLPICELQAVPLKAPGLWATGPGCSPTHLKMKVPLKKKNLDVTKKVHFLSVLS